MRIKNLLSDSLGASTGILFYLFTLLVVIFPIVMITTSFNLPWWVGSIMLFASLFISSNFSVVYMIVGLVGAIKGPQDVFAIIYYIYFSLIVFLPYIIKLIGIFVRFFANLFTKTK